MSLRLSAAAVAVATLVAIPSASADAQRGTFSSRSHGPTFGVSLGAVGLNTRDLGPLPAKEFSGAGVQMEVGWHMLASHFGVILDYTNVNLDEGEGQS